ncbi:MAG: OmpH family outer membrane protein [Bacteroidales bacterium]
MRNFIKIFAVIAFAAMSFTVSAQKNQKFGHVDFAKLYAAMPGQDSVKAKMQDYMKSIQDQYAAMQTEYESKVNDYTANKETMSGIIKQTKEKEIGDLQDRMQAFQNSAQQAMSDKETELTAPIIEKAKTAVKEVAKEGGYTYVFNSTEGLLLYAEPNDDIMALVKKKLGLN